MLLAMNLNHFFRNNKPLKELVNSLDEIQDPTKGQQYHNFFLQFQILYYINMNVLKIDSDVSDLKHLLEKRIGFQGPDHADEAIDLLKDFASAGKMLNQEIENKQIQADDPVVQEIVTILDDNLSIDSKFIEDIQMVLDLIQELPDKPKEKPKIGFLK